MTLDKIRKSMSRIINYMKSFKFSCFTTNIALMIEELNNFNAADP